MISQSIRFPSDVLETVSDVTNPHPQETEIKRRYYSTKCEPLETWIFTKFLLINQYQNVFKYLPISVFSAKVVLH
jgi:hypothetical protein